MLVSKNAYRGCKNVEASVTTLEIDGLCGKFVCPRPQNNTFFLKITGVIHLIFITSVNDVVVHGFPNNTGLRDGDLVSIDMGVILNGWHGDHAFGLS